MQVFYLIVLGLHNGFFIPLSNPNPYKIIGYRVKSIDIFGQPQSDQNRKCLDYCEAMAAASNIKIQFH